ncbi:MAG: hypothetical protein AAGG75_24170 [Bacteroidota bacterium]
MKTYLTFLCAFFLFSVSINAQDSAPASKQVGVTTLPIIYLNNGIGTDGGFGGIAVYGNYGWIFKNYNVVGLRPFWGYVDSGSSRNQHLQSLGSNVYYRRYFNRNRLSFFVDANIGLGYIWYSSDSPSFEETLQELNGLMFNYAFGPGVDFEIKNGWNVELIIQYLQMQNIDHPEDTNVGKSLIPSIGVQKFF